MKFLLVILSLLSAISVYATDVFVVEGHGQDWGYTAIEAAKLNATQQAQQICNSEVELFSDWDVKIVSRKEGVFHVVVHAEFKCTGNN